jgi:hypothetical protein
VGTAQGTRHRSLGARIEEVPRCSVGIGATWLVSLSQQVPRRSAIFQKGKEIKEKNSRSFDSME